MGRMNSSEERVIPAEPEGRERAGNERKRGRDSTALARNEEDGGERRGQPGKVGIPFIGDARFELRWARLSRASKLGAHS